MTQADAEDTGIMHISGTRMHFADCHRGAQAMKRKTNEDKRT